MAINPNIALALKTPEPFDPLAAYGKIAAIQQAQNQNALAQYQLGAAQRAETRDVAKANALALAGTDEGEIANALLKAGDTAGYTSFMNAVEERRNKKATTAHTIATTDEVRGKIVDATVKRYRDAIGQIDPNSPAAGARLIAAHEANHSNPVMADYLKSIGVNAANSRADIDAAIAQGPQGIANFIARSSLDAEKFQTLNASKLITTNRGPTTETTAYSPLTGETKRVLTEQMAVGPEARERLDLEAKRVRQEGERIGLEGRRVRVLENQAELAKDPAHQARMAAARASGEATAKNDVAAVQNLPKIVGNANDALNLIDQMVGKPPVKDASGRVIEKGTAPHPGFQNAVGATWLPGIRFVPGTDAANFMALFNQTEGSAFLEAFEALKGGGAITETEGKKATDARTRMATAQSEGEFMKAAREYQGILRRGIENAQKRASTASSRLGTSSGGTAPSVSDW